MLYMADIIHATSEQVCAYQIDPSFYFDLYGLNALGAIRQVVQRINAIAPSVPLIIDAKLASMGDGSKGLAHLWCDDVGADAITVCPYYGRDALLSLLKRRNKGVIVNCRTTNDDAREFQDAVVVDQDDNKMPLHMLVAWRVSQYWHEYGNCALTIGADQPTQLREIRDMITQADRPLTVPFFIYRAGSLGSHNLEGDIEQSVVNGRSASGDGISFVTGRTVLYASRGSDYFQAAKTMAEKMNTLIVKSLKA
jgi:orotidine-5'-phosphate decarboxylase